MSTYFVRKSASVLAPILEFILLKRLNMVILPVVENRNNYSMI